MAKRPSFQFYPADWLSDSKLQRCTHEEKGVWIELLCLLHDSEEYGILRWTLKELAHVLHCKISILQNLLKYGVLKGSERDGEGVSFSISISKRNAPPEHVVLLENESIPLYFSARMVRDEFIRKRCAINGYKSLQNPAVPRPRQLDRDSEGDIEGVSLSPSGSPSSTSSSSSTSTSIKKEPPCIPPSSRGKNATQLPDNFMYNDKHAMLATELGVNVMTEFEHFKDHHLARGSTFKNWNFAFNTWLRNAKKFSKGTKPHGQQESYIDMLKRAGETLTRMRSNPFPEIQVDLGGEVDEKHH